MRIVCIGGGPAGLYFSILMKKAVPAADITVVERNAPGVTFGWGVVFSDGTLEYLAENDRETHAAIRDAFVHWDAIDIFYRGETLRSGGHGFSGIARRELLRLLQARCASLGVRLAFEQEVDDLDALGDADLIVAADGVNSKIRRAREDVFRPSIRRHDARYIWLGTRKRFDAFTFLFEENADGMFQVHAYGFDAETSTFIVECDERSWRAAGLDRKTVDESLAYLEALFAAHLDGHRLLANHASWIQFLTVKNETWRDGRVVLVGDAAHTAHFSIGSGTKLAMEDAIALAAACSRGGSVDAALERYEADRRPIVERTQRAAEASLTWFENVRAHARAEPHEFAFSLLTRSSRITYEALAARDPAFVAAVTESFASRAAGAGSRAPGDAPPPPMRTGFALRELRLASRVVAQPPEAPLEGARGGADVDGAPSEAIGAALADAANAGAGLVLAGRAYVSRDGRASRGSAGMYGAGHVASWRAVVDEVRRTSRAAIGIALGHAGVARIGDGDGGRGGALASPANAMDRAAMARVVDDFVRAARMAEGAGFDYLEVHMGAGELLGSFLAPASNARTDAYGGSFDGRARFPLEVFAAVRAAWPSDRPLGARLATIHPTPAAIGREDAVALARALHGAGCDLLDVSPGVSAARRERGGATSPLDDTLRHHVDVATLAVGPIVTADQVNTLVASRRADLCAVDVGVTKAVLAGGAARAPAPGGGP